MFSKLKSMFLRSQVLAVLIGTLINTWGLFILLQEHQKSLVRSVEEPVLSRAKVQKARRSRETAFNLLGSGTFILAMVSLAQVFYLGMNR